VVLQLRSQSAFYSISMFATAFRGTPLHGHTQAKAHSPNSTPTYVHGLPLSSPQPYIRVHTISASTPYGLRIRSVPTLRATPGFGRGGLAPRPAPAKGARWAPRRPPAPRMKVWAPRFHVHVEDDCRNSLPDSLSRLIRKLSVDMFGSIIVSLLSVSSSLGHSNLGQCSRIVCQPWGIFANTESETQLAGCKLLGKHPCMSLLCKPQLKDCYSH
jgi:hypothetical protein